MGRSPSHRHQLQSRTSATAYTVRAAPFALWSLLQLRVQADQVVCPRASVTQNDLPTLLAHFTVVLVVCLIAVTIINWKGERGNDGGTAAHNHFHYPRPDWHMIGA